MCFDPVNVSGSCVTREAEGDVQGGSRGGQVWKVFGRQSILHQGSLRKFSDRYGGWGHLLMGNLNFKVLTLLDGVTS